MYWNEIPYDEKAAPDVKALEFDLQVRENGGNPYPPIPYEPEWPTPEQQATYAEDPCGVTYEYVWSV